IRAHISDRYGKIQALPSASSAGPAQYITAENLKGKVGFISALSNCFCKECNRIRLTSTGFLKACLQYDRGIYLRELLSQEDEKIKEAMMASIYQKPEAHQFNQ